MNGGYTMYDMKGSAVTATAKTFTGLYDKILYCIEHNKLFVLKNFKVSSYLFTSIAPQIYQTGNNCYFTFIGHDLTVIYRVAISSTDKVTLTTKNITD